MGQIRPSYRSNRSLSPICVICTLHGADLPDLNDAHMFRQLRCTGWKGVEKGERFMPVTTGKEKITGDPGRVFKGVLEVVLKGKLKRVLMVESLVAYLSVYSRVCLWVSSWVRMLKV